MCYIALKRENIEEIREKMENSEKLNKGKVEAGKEGFILKDLRSIYG